MNRSYRSAHRWIILLLSIVLPALVVLGLSNRPSQQWAEPLRSEMRLPTVSPDLKFYLASNDLWSGLPITSYVYRNDQQLVVYLFQDKPITEADLLVYLEPAIADENIRESQADEVAMGRLLSSFSNAQPARFELSSAQHQSGGRLVIYSQGKGTELAAIQLPLIERSGPEVR